MPGLAAPPDRSRFPLTLLPATPNLANSFARYGSPLGFWVLPDRHCPDILKKTHPKLI